MWRLVHQWSFLLFDCFWLFLTIGTLLLHCWYSLDSPVTIGTSMVIFAVLTVSFDCIWLFLAIGVPIVTCLPRLYQQCTNRQKQTKIVKQQKNDHWCTNRYMSTQSPPNTQSSRRRSRPRPRPPSASVYAEYTKPKGRKRCDDVW